MTDPTVQDLLLLCTPAGGECMRWAGRKRDGYSQATIGGKTVRVHRYVYEKVYGSIPHGLQIHHTCENRDCLNPTHLEAKTPVQHLMLHDSISMQNARKTHCPRGHEYTEGNTYQRPRPGGKYERECMACRRDAASKLRRRRGVLKRAS